MVKASKRDITSLFQTDYENLVAVLGEGYLSSFLQGGGMSKCFMALSDQRLYVKGKVMKDMKWTNYDTALNVEKLSSSTITSKTNTRLIVLLALLTIVTGGFHILLGLILYLLPPTRSWISGYISPKMFRVEYEGGVIEVSARWYQREELSTFRRKLTYAYEKRNS